MTLAQITQRLQADGLLKSARQRADRGIESSRQHAEQDAPGWGEMALTMVRWFSKVKDRQYESSLLTGPVVGRNHYAWTAEECRLWCAAHDLPDPPELRAWGSVIQRALREGLIVKTGGFRATASSNGSVRALYRKA